MLPTSSIMVSPKILPIPGVVSSEINSFLKNAGYKYNVSLKEDNDGQHRLKLSHNDLNDESQACSNHAIVNLATTDTLETMVKNLDGNDLQVRNLGVVITEI